MKYDAFVPNTHNLIVYTVEPVYSDTLSDQGNVSHCRGCQNLSNPSH